MSIDTTLEELEFADIYEIALPGRERLFLTNYGGTYFQLPRIDGNEYRVLPITRTAASYHSTLEADVMDISFDIHAFTISGRSIVEAIQLGWFDSAEIIVTTINPKMTAERREVFRGVVGKKVEFDRKTVKLSATGGLGFGKQTVPKIFYQEPCNHRLYDPYCRVVKATFERAGVAQAGSTRVRIFHPVFSFASNPSGFFFLGEFKFASGPNAGRSRIIRFHNDGNVEMYIPFDFDVAVGNAFLAYAGCDKSGTTCQGRFSNYINFLGFEFVPRPEVLYG